MKAQIEFICSPVKPKWESSERHSGRKSHNRYSIHQFLSPSDSVSGATSSGRSSSAGHERLAIGGKGNAQIDFLGESDKRFALEYGTDRSD